MASCPRPGSSTQHRKQISVPCHFQLNLVTLISCPNLNKEPRVLTLSKCGPSIADVFGGLLGYLREWVGINVTVWTHYMALLSFIETITGLCGTEWEYGVHFLPESKRVKTNSHEHGLWSQTAWVWFPSQLLHLLCNLGQTNWTSVPQFPGIRIALTS